MFEVAHYSSAITVKRTLPAGAAVVRGCCSEAV